MSNRTLYFTMLAFAAAAAVSAQSDARAETPGHASLMELICDDLDRGQADFATALADATGRRINARLAAAETELGPLVAVAPEETGRTIDAAAAGAAAKLDAAAIASAEYEVGKDAANIETPFNPRPAMPPAAVAFDSGA